MKIQAYDLQKYMLHTEVEKIFNVSELTLLHLERPDLLPSSLLTFENESKTSFHEKFYGALHEGKLEVLKEKYQKFIEAEVRPKFSDSIAVQAFPSFRVHLPNDQAIHKWHYDSDHDHRHPEWEINYFLPLTDAVDTQTIWLESVPGLRDYSPINLKYGEYVIFDGNRSMHGNKQNLSGKCRVSFDFRILPINRLPKADILSVTAGKKFQIGDYYRLVK